MNGTAATMIRGLEVGGEATFTAHGRTFTAKRLRRDVWHLRDRAVTERSRFGDRNQITQDVACALTYGVLPSPCGPRW